MPITPRQQNTLVPSRVTTTAKMPTALRVVTGAALASTFIMAGCSTINDTLAGDKIDYRTSGSQTVKLDVPPDLSQLPGQQRYAQSSATAVSASSLSKGDGKADTASVGSMVAPTQVGTVKLVRDGKARWLAVNMPPEQVWEQLRGFWHDVGFELTTDRPEAGLMETNWSENKAKAPQDGVIRKTLGRVFDALYDTGERDMYRTRIERTAEGCDIYITHRGLSEEYEDNKKERTTWRARPSDPTLEAEMLSRLMAKLGASSSAVTAAKADKPAAVASSTSPSTARMNADGMSMTVDAEFDVAWRRVGLALDRSGFTVESRDRKAGNYEVRLSDSDVEANKPGFFARLFGASTTDGLSRYKVTVQGQGKNSLVSILDDKGQPARGDTAKRIAKLLLNELG